MKKTNYAEIAKEKAELIKMTKEMIDLEGDPNGTKRNLVDRLTDELVQMVLEGKIK